MGKARVLSDAPEQGEPVQGCKLQVEDDQPGQRSGPRFGSHFQDLECRLGIRRSGKAASEFGLLQRPMKQLAFARHVLDQQDAPAPHHGLPVHTMSC